MGKQDTFSEAKFPVPFGPCDGCGGMNFYSENRFKEYQEHGWYSLLYAQVASFCGVPSARLRLSGQSKRSRPQKFKMLRR